MSADSTSVVMLYPTADSYVNSTSPADNYGGAGTLYVAANTEQCFSYILFDVSILPANATIVSANLTVYVSSKTGTIYMGEAIGAYCCINNSWEEYGLAWDNSPVSNTTPTSAWPFLAGTYSGYKIWDVTVDVQTAASSGILTEVLKFTNKLGDAQVLLQSRESANKPALYVEYTTGTGPEPEPETETTLSSFALQFAANNVHVIYPSDNPEKPLGCVAGWVSDWMASAFVTTKLHSYTEGLDIDSGFVDQTSGRPAGASGQGIISFGGPVVNPVVKYAESGGTVSADRAPIKFYGSESDFYFQHGDGTGIAGANLPISVINNDEDMFVIEVYIDNSGRYVMLCYGFGWKGTYASGKYFDTVIYPGIASYDISWIIVKWQDTNGDGFVNNPSDGDIYTVIAEST